MPFKSLYKIFRGQAPIVIIGVPLLLNIIPQPIEPLAGKLQNLAHR